MGKLKQVAAILEEHAEPCSYCAEYEERITALEERMRVLENDGYDLDYHRPQYCATTGCGCLARSETHSDGCGFCIQCEPKLECKTDDCTNFVKEGLVYCKHCYKEWAEERRQRKENRRINEEIARDEHPTGGYIPFDV